MQSVKLPASVVRGSVKAEEILRSRAQPAPQEPVIAEPVVPPTPVPETPPVAPVEPVVEIQQPLQEPAKVPEVKPEKSTDYWEHRIKTLQGIFDAEKRKAADKVSNLESEIIALKQQLKETERKIPREYDLRKYLSEQEIELHGEDHLKTVFKMARSLIDEEVDTVQQNSKKQLEEETKKIQQEAARVKEEAFWSTLNTNVPDWQEINGDTNFHMWLSEIDPLYGITRQELLTNAESARDANRVSAFFKTFKNQTKPQVIPVRTVEQKIIPESVPSAQVTTIPDADQVRVSEIEKFTRDKIRGVYKNRQAEMERMENRINKAIREKRVISG